MAAPRKTSTARKRPAAKPAPALGLVLGTDEDRSAVAALVADREPLFSVGETTYTIPRNVPVSWSMKAYALAVTDGETAVLNFAARKLLTDEAYMALIDSEPSDEKLHTVLKALVDRILPEGLGAPKA
jgi:hypothetical protein